MKDGSIDGPMEIDIHKHNTHGDRHRDTDSWAHGARHRHTDPGTKAWTCVDVPHGDRHRHTDIDGPTENDTDMHTLGDAGLQLQPDKDAGLAGRAPRKEI
eukprot:7173888-Heterocapsa_arctica.AAC.1